MWKPAMNNSVNTPTHHLKRKKYFHCVQTAYRSRCNYKGWTTEKSLLHYQKSKSSSSQKRPYWTWTHQTPYSISSGTLSLKIKPPERKAGRLLSSNAAVKMIGAISPLPHTPSLRAQGRVNPVPEFVCRNTRNIRNAFVSSARMGELASFLSKMLLTSYPIRISKYYTLNCCGGCGNIASGIVNSGTRKKVSC